MKIEKRVYGVLEKAYCLNFLPLKNAMTLIAASEKEGGGCVRYDFDSGAATQVWENRGGTMTICPTDDRGGVLAVQNFFMGFQAETARIVCTQQDEKGVYGKEQVFAELPFVHRFGLVEANDHSAKYVVACTVTTAKDNRDDWSRAGSVLISEYDTPFTKPVFTERCKLHKNHGYWHGTYNGRDVVFISAEEGLFALYPPKTKGAAFEMEPILSREISDAVAVDIDNDGIDEIMAIEKFHGNLVTINKRVNGEWVVVYETEATFAHALWAGKLLGRNSFLMSYRKNDAELLLFTQAADGSIEKTRIDAHIATPNIDVFQKNGKAYIVAADRTDPQAETTVVYELSNH